MHKSSTDGNESSNLSSKVDERTIGQMPGDLEFAGYAEAFPLAKLTAGGRPRSQDGFLSDRAWAIGAAGERAAIFIDIDIDGGAGWVFAITDSQSEGTNDGEVQ